MIYKNHKDTDIMKKRFVLFILALFMGVILLSQTQAAAFKQGVTYIWNGTGAFEEGVNFSVRSEIHISSTVTVPENCTLFVRGDGTLVIDKGGELIVKGTVKINSNGILRNYGSMTVEKSGTVNTYGWLINREKASLKNYGNVNIFTSGRCNNYGRFTGCKDSVLYVTGHYYIRNNGILDMYGKMRVQPSAFVRSYNEINVYSGGVVNNSGKIDVTDGGVLYLQGGKLNVKKNASVTGEGSLQLTRFLALDSQGKVSLNINPPQPRQVNGVYYVGEVLICNKKYPLPESFGDGIYAEAYNALEKMRRDSGYPMEVLSGYRSYQYQEQTFAYWESLYGTARAEQISARAGTSEHQTGLAFDISSLNVSYINTYEGKWLNENCWKYGFIIRFPDGCQNHTGYSYEPWHIRYVGVELAKQIHENSCCLEHYLGLA